LARLALAALINIALICATFGFVSWLPTFFAEEGRNLPSALMMSAIITAGAPVGALLGMLVTDLFERKWTTAAVAAIAASLGAGYALAPDTLLLPAGFATVVAIYAYGAVALTGYMPELFATPIRMRAIGVAITAGRVVAVGLPALIVVIFARFGQAGVIGMVAGVLLVLAVAVALVGVRTRGRSLDAI
jgi:putative MFS transporter